MKIRLPTQRDTTATSPEQGWPEVKLTWTELFMVNCEVWLPQNVKVLLPGGTNRVTTVTLMSEPLLFMIAVNWTKLTVPLTTDKLEELSAPETRTVPQPISSNDKINRSTGSARLRGFLYWGCMTTTAIRWLF